MALGNYNRSRITALSLFGRSIRDEPSYGIYKHRIYPEQNTVEPAPVVAWLADRYTSKSGLFQVVTYKHRDGCRYVHYVETQRPLSDDELVEFRFRWGLSQTPIKRDGRLKRRRLTKEQRAILNDRLEAIREEFYASLSA